MDNRLRKAKEITERYAKICCGDIAYLTRKESLAVINAMQTLSIMPNGKERMLGANRLFYWPDGMPDENTPTGEYCLEFLALVSGFMGWFEQEEKEKYERKED